MKPEAVIINVCMNIKTNEKCLIIYDNEKKDIADNLFNYCKDYFTVEKIKISKLKYNGQEPPIEISKKMLEYDAILITTQKSLTHTNAVRDAIKNNARVASMPGITNEIINRAIDIDYKKMHLLIDKLCDILDKGKEVLITTKKGTNLKLSIENRLGFGREDGLFYKSKKMGNLPSGEAFIAPIEEKTNGKLVVDLSIAGIGKLEDEEIIFDIENGIIKNIDGKIKAKEFSNIINSVDDKNAFIACELGIGTNPKAKISGIVLEDEKVYGTCHIAFGNNISFGGKNKVSFHSDGVIDKPTIIIDGKKIMDEGKFLV
ncbi:MAG: aminopeptidase [Candidatus Woesearchaeota archaeon]